ncbi:hypothetical protein HMPREF0972_00502 [Actinomyces sp. oral taxon 848 str. F0332]|nr:hypothetical protein HMPREF0972_00502 [Actinomyces sp. oral taxon 848 str. F0332]
MLQVSYEKAVVDQEFSKIVRVDRPLSLVRFGLVSLSTALSVIRIAVGVESRGLVVGLLVVLLG